VTLLAFGRRDFTRPVFVSATVSADGQSTLLQFSEVLKQTSVPATTALSYTGTVATIVATSIVGDTVILTNAPVIHADETSVAVSYVVPVVGKIQDAAGNLAAALSAEPVTNGSTVATPLGDAFWDLYFDARDYEGTLTTGDTVIAPLVPRVGAGLITPVNAPTVSGGVLGIGNRLAFKTLITGPSCFDAFWLAPLLSGVKKPGTMGCRWRRTTAANAIVFGFGKSTSTVNSFFELLQGAVGQNFMRKNDGVAATVSQIGTTNPGSAVQDAFFTNDGNTGKLYVNGLLEATMDISALSANVVIDQCRLGNSGRNFPGGGGGGLGGFSQVYVFSTNVASDADILAVHNAWLADDFPPPSGAQVYFIGDSTTKLQGLRLATYDYYTTHVPVLDIDMVGSFNDGNFPDNQHSAVNGATLLGINNRVNLELGAGNAFSDVLLVHLLAGVNDLNDPGANVPAILTAYANLLTNINTRITGTQPTARIAVTTIQPLQPGTMGEAEVVAFNAGLPAIWNAFDAAHPATPLIRWDLYNALGGAWNGAYYLDSAHNNATGYAVACAEPTYGLIQAIGPYLVAIG
jgi:lysophospholipase L1-like esterase